MYLFDIANKLREDAAVKEALVCRVETGSQPLVAYVILKDELRETEEEIRRRLEASMATFLPAGLRIDNYRFEHGHLRINLVGKIDRHYYLHPLT